MSIDETAGPGDGGVGKAMYSEYISAEILCANGIYCTDMMPLDDNDHDCCYDNVLSSREIKAAVMMRRITTTTTDQNPQSNHAPTSPSLSK